MSGAICRQYAATSQKSRNTKGSRLRETITRLRRIGEAASFDLESGKVCVNSPFLWRANSGAKFKCLRVSNLSGWWSRDYSDVNPACAYSSNDRTESYN
jgi:hypothetical protein